MKIAYLDCFSGLSGDMFLGALVAAGLEPAALYAGLAGLSLDGYRLHFEQVARGFMSGTRVRVEVADGQKARRATEIFALLEGSGLSPSVKSKSRAVFERLVAAEARVHGEAPQEVHLHELGAVDALVDVVGTVSGLEQLGIDELWVSPLPCPRGWQKCQHGLLPLPAPAVTELLMGVPVYGVDSEAELVTPTGAALAVALASGFGPMPLMRLLRTGYGAGARELRHPNLLRLLIGEGSPHECRPGSENQQSRTLKPELVAIAEAAIGDMNPEFYPYVAERLRELGALDVYWTQIQMKKGRPGVLLTALLPLNALMAAADLFFSETTTLGLRWRLENRLAAPRDLLRVEVNGHPIRVKYSVSMLKGRKSPFWQVAPEYEDCRLAASKLDLPVKEIYLRAQEESRSFLRQLFLVGPSQ